LPASATSIIFGQKRRRHRHASLPPRMANQGHSRLRDHGPHARLRSDFKGVHGRTHRTQWRPVQGKGGLDGTCSGARRTSSAGHASSARSAAWHGVSPRQQVQEQWQCQPSAYFRRRRQPNQASLMRPSTLAPSGTCHRLFIEEQPVCHGHQASRAPRPKSNSSSAGNQFLRSRRTVDGRTCSR